MISHKGNESQVYSIELKEVLCYNSIDQIILDRATQRSRDAFFASPRVYIQYLETIMSFKIPETLTMQFIEIKATRDVYVHDDGSANKTYINKVGALARSTISNPLSVDPKYLSSSVSCMKDIFSAIYRGMIDTYGDSEEISKVLADRRTG
jgi:hypothetical protein